MAHLEEKIPTMEDQIKEEIKKLPKTQKARAVALNNILLKKKNLDSELEKEIKALEFKYEQLSQPIYQQSAQLISGSRLPNEEELNNLDEFLTEQEKEQGRQALVDIPENQQPIDGYWLQVLKNCDQLAHEVHPKDEELLKSLLNIEYIGKEAGKQDFSLVFTFGPNEYFTNDKIIKTFLHKEGEEEHYKTEATEINWKEGKNITVKKVTKKQKNKKSGQQRTITKEVEDESFFNFLKPTELKEDVEDEEEEQMLLEKMNQEADIAQTLIDEVIPYSLEYYLGVKAEDDGEFGDEEDFEDEIPEDDEDDDDEPKQKSKKKPAAKQHKASGENKDAGQGQQQAECKQQ